MIFPERSPYVRIVPGHASLDMILKNTHFPDELLAPDAPIRCSLQWDGPTPVLVFAFKTPAYDFSEPLPAEQLAAAAQDLLNQPQIKVRLLLADSVIADQVAARNFVLSDADSTAIRKALLTQ
ncbi:hypothetical protein GCM10010967_44480 [Dyadobacter beijingensis]|uniref:Uncharacterized protein n=1 Tax=Dyadobacter beijingensis TaxID=365489 RepID=A0ABQ2IDW4_9BACT|nr:hypothetical protein [Dyadobacter beijingensis]GGN04611.1 hypothetical protein GCM10010967_44480 [Dyadobacter beijingensis]